MSDLSQGMIDAFLAATSSDFVPAPRAAKPQHLVETDEQGPNQSVVMFNWILTATLKGNTCPIRIVAAGHAASCGAYLCKYVTKDDQVVTSVLTLFRAAKAYTDDPANTSVADDKGTPLGDLRYALNRFLNCVAGASEIGAATAAACLLQIPNEMKSTRFWFAFVLPALSFVVAKRAAAVAAGTLSPDADAHLLHLCRPAAGVKPAVAKVMAAVAAGAGLRGADDSPDASASADDSPDASASGGEVGVGDFAAGDAAPIAAATAVGGGLSAAGAAPAAHVLAAVHGGGRDGDDLVDGMGR